MSTWNRDDALLARHPEGEVKSHVAMPEGIWVSAPPARKADNGDSIDMYHKPCGGEVRGMRDASDRFVKQLVDAGNDPAYARRVAGEQARRMERRLHRGPKDVR